MRSTLILFVLACGTAFGQDSLGASPENADHKINDNLRQRVGDILNPQNVRSRGSLVTAVPAPIRVTAATPPTFCSIPLLSAVAPDKPVPMPGAGPRTNPPDLAHPIDRMRIATPGLACRAGARLTPPPTKP